MFSAWKELSVIDKKNGVELFSFDYTGFLIGILEMVCIIPTGSITSKKSPNQPGLLMAQMDVPKLPSSKLHPSERWMIWL